MKTFDAHILLIITKFCAKIKVHKLCQLYFLSSFRFFDTRFFNVRPSIVFIDAHFMAKKCIRNKAAFSLLI